MWIGGPADSPHPRTDGTGARGLRRPRCASGPPEADAMPNPAGASKATVPKIARVYHRPSPRGSNARLIRGKESSRVVGLRVAVRSRAEPIRAARRLAASKKVIGQQTMWTQLISPPPPRTRVATKQLTLRGEPCKNETFWHDSDPWLIFSTSSRVL